MRQGRMTSMADSWWSRSIPDSNPRNYKHRQLGERKGGMLPTSLDSRAWQITADFISDVLNPAGILQFSFKPLLMFCCFVFEHATMTNFHSAKMCFNENERVRQLGWRIYQEYQSATEKNIIPVLHSTYRIEFHFHLVVCLDKFCLETVDQNFR